MAAAVLLLPLEGSGTSSPRPSPVPRVAQANSGAAAPDSGIWVLDPSEPPVSPLLPQTGDFCPVPAAEPTAAFRGLWELGTVRPLMGHPTGCEGLSHYGF